MKSKAVDSTQEGGPWRRMLWRVENLWVSSKNAVTIGLFGISGSTVAGSFHHVIQACRGGNCINCGSCVVALGVGVAAASAGVAGRTSGRKRWRLVALVAFVGLLLYGLLEAFKSGLLTIPG